MNLEVLGVKPYVHKLPEFPLNFASAYLFTSNVPPYSVIVAVFRSLVSLLHS